MRQLKYWLGIALLATVFIGGCTSQPKLDITTNPDKKTSITDKNFTLPDLSGKDVKFPEDFLGKKTLLVFFATG